MLTHNKAPIVCIITGTCCKTLLNENTREVFASKSKYPGILFSHLLSGITLQRVYELIIKILWIFCFALTLTLMTKSGHSFAYKFLSYVENCALIEIVRIYVRATCNLTKFGLWAHNTVVKCVRGISPGSRYIDLSPRHLVSHLCTSDLTTH